MLLPFVLLSAALAQGPMGQRGPRQFGAPGATPPAPQFDELKAYLNLTDSQIQSIQQAQQKAMESQRTVFEQIRTKHQALRDLLDKGTSDAAAVGKAMLEIHALQKQAQQARTTTGAQLVGFLTTEQKTKLAALEQAARLQPAIHQAIMLGLLAPAEPPAGGFGPLRQFAPVRQGFGARALAPGRMGRAFR
jgi:Spy/CpxP family protein refolding chaperone